MNKKIFVVSGLLVTLTSAASAQIIYSEDFETGFAAANIDTQNGWVGFDTAGDGSPNGAPFNTWLCVTEAEVGGLSSVNTTRALNQFWDSDEVLDDVAISPSFALTSGTSYNVSYWLEANGLFATASDVEVYITTDNTSAANAIAAGTIVNTHTDFVGAADQAGVFVATTTGNHFFMVRDVSAPANSSYFTLVDDILITDPASVNDWNLIEY